MEYGDIKEKIGKKASIIADNGRVFVGVITNAVNEFETESGKEEIEVDLGGTYLGLPIDEVKKVLVID